MFWTQAAVGSLLSELIMGNWAWRYIELAQGSSSNNESLYLVIKPPVYISHRAVAQPDELSNCGFATKLALLFSFLC